MDSNIVKINCDASWCPTTGQKGIGVIARNHSGEICGGWRSSTNGGSIEELEANTILQAVTIAVEKRWHRVTIESDAEVVINHLRGTDSLWRIDTIMLNVKMLTTTIESVAWDAIPMTVNICADWISN